jgi:FAD:protein FMN transferase
VAHDDPAEAHAAIDAAIAALRRVDDSMSAFKPASDVGRANLGAARGPVAVSRETRDVLQESLRWADESQGRFDPCLGRATRAWDVTHRHEPPAEAAYSGLANRQLYRALELDTQSGRPIVRFHDEDVRVDLGGIAKGYGVDRAVACLREHGIAHALVGAGGDIYALGRSPAGEPWTIGIQSPDRPDALAASLRLEDAAIATSGDYRQFFEHEHRRYHHLLDPATASPRRTTERSVSIVADTTTAADAAATLAFGASSGEVDGILRRHGARVAHLI